MLETQERSSQNQVTLWKNSGKRSRYGHVRSRFKTERITVIKLNFSILVLQFHFVKYCNRV
jgi:hypothetical protein